ncbi:MAG: hypothetical protein HYZ45_00295, partial [Burkholderiales bacterium]|nr:hypothetical protein [Burkholderiales bacterium]
MKNNTHAGNSAGTRFRTYLASTAVGLLLAGSPFDLALAAPHALPPKVQSLVDATLQQRWPEQQVFAPVTAVRQEKIDEQRSIYLVQINYEGFVILVEQGEQVRLVAYGQHGGEDLYPQDGALQEWLSALTRQLKKGQTKGDAESKPAAFSAPLAASVAITPLTTSTWGQSGFYNDATPPDGSTVP